MYYILIVKIALRTVLGAEFIGVGDDLISVCVCVCAKSNLSVSHYVIFVIKLFVPLFISLVSNIFVFYILFCIIVLVANALFIMLSLCIICCFCIIIRTTRNCWCYIPGFSHSSANSQSATAFAYIK